MGPLEGLRVIDIGMLAAGPWAATFLADLGADVIKVEHPEHDDPSRHFGASVGGHTLFWKNVGRNKRCVTLDLAQPRGQDLLKRLAAESDVLIENFRAGTLERWNLGWAELRRANPRLVVVRTSGFGQEGPYAAFPGFGTLAESMSGFANLTGESDGPPQLPQFPLADGIAALVGTIGALAGIYHRDVRGGTGQWIDNTLYEPLMRLMELMVTEYAETGTVRRRTGNRLPDIVPRGAYRTSEPDRWVTLSGSNAATARRVLQAIERPDLVDDPRLADNAGRREHPDLIDAAIADWVGRHTVAEVIERFRAADAPIATVYDASDILADPHFTARNTHVRVDDPDLGTITMQNVMPRFSETPGEIRHVGGAKGQHNVEIYQGLLGLTDAEIADLHAEKVV